MPVKNLKLQLKNVPDKVGVYLFKDAKDKIIYVGKAGNLRKRVSSYFRSISNSLKPKAYPPLAEKTNLLVKQIASLDFYLTDNETEALLVEINLIKKYRPKFNVSYKDDKSYPYLAITAQDDFPRICLTREPHRPGVEYYGPYTRAGAARNTLDTLRKIFPVRTCFNSKLAASTKRKRPCLDYHIKRCLGPCLPEVSSSDYRQELERVRLFLKGKADKVTQQLEYAMKKAAEGQEFEKAAILRNRLKEAKQILEKQKIVTTSKVDRDVIGMAEDGKVASVEILFIRDGKLIESENFLLRTGQDEVLPFFIKEHYLSISALPKEIILPFEVGERSLLERCLSQRAGRKISIKIPKRGEKKKLVELAEKNAHYALEKHKTKSSLSRRDHLEALADLKKELALEISPYRIECFDVSTLFGQASTASMVVFVNGQPKRSDYRRFRIKQKNAQDDLSHLKEAITRRFKRYLDQKGKVQARFGLRPDLVVVDGGKPQLSTTFKTLGELGIKDIPIAALAKKEEEIYALYPQRAFPQKPRFIRLPRTSQALKLVQRIRDEAHRFAVEYHRLLREKKMFTSTLDDVPGVGTVHKKDLLKTFRTVEAVSQASVSELNKVSGVSLSLAEQVHRHFRSIGDKK